MKKVFEASDRLDSTKSNKRMISEKNQTSFYREFSDIKSSFTHVKKTLSRSTRKTEEINQVSICQK